MNSTQTLSGTHQRTYQTIFQHPLSHNLQWHDVRALLSHLGQVEEEPNGNLKVTRHGHSMVLHPSRTKDVAEVDELMALRHFLERSNTAQNILKKNALEQSSALKQTPKIIAAPQRLQS